MYSRRTFMGSAAATTLSLNACATAPDLAPPHEETSWEEIRSHFLYPPDVGYFNTGTLGASPREVVEAFVGYVEKLEETLPEYDYRNDEEPPLGGYEEFTAYREDMGSMVGAHADEIALTLNATMGMNFTAAGLMLGEGEEVIMTNQEHPGGIGPWKLQAVRRGAKVTEVDIVPHKDDPDAIVKAFANAITPKTRVIMVSHLTSGRGILIPAKRICALAKERGLIAVLDGAQTVGQIKVDPAELGCDFYINSPHKWLGGPKGTGFLWVRKGIEEKVTATMASAQFANPKWGVARLQQIGTSNVGKLHGLRAAIRFQQSIGIERIEARARTLTRRLRDGLDAIGGIQYASSTHADMSAGVTVFRAEGVGVVELEEALWLQKIRVRSVGEDMGVRTGTHYYTQESEVDRLLEVVADVRKRKGAA